MLPQLSALIAHLHTRQEGQGLAEYALILGLIAVVAIVTLILLGNSIAGAFSFITHTL